MLMEGIKRLEPLHINFPMFKLPGNQIWPTICRTIAEAAAKACASLYPHLQHLKYAEPFRLQYLGIVEKLRPMLPKSVAIN